MISFYLKKIMSFIDKAHVYVLQCIFIFDCIKVTWEFIKIAHSSTAKVKIMSECME